MKQTILVSLALVSVMNFFNCNYCDAKNKVKKSSGGYARMTDDPPSSRINEQDAKKSSRA